MEGMKVNAQAGFSTRAHAVSEKFAEDMERMRERQAYV